MINNEETISTIVCIYNFEDRLVKCFKGIVNQNYEKITNMVNKLFFKYVKESANNEK